jgi:hypothetical protein
LDSEFPVSFGLKFALEWIQEVWCWLDLEGIETQETFPRITSTLHSYSPVQLDSSIATLLTRTCQYGKIELPTKVSESLLLERECACAEG